VGRIKPEFEKEAHIRSGIMILPPRTFLNGMESWTTYKPRQTKMKTVHATSWPYNNNYADSEEIRIYRSQEHSTDEILSTREIMVMAAKHSRFQSLI
jgi:hypothetical protein